ncbi:acylpyruvate hydrolase [Pelagirhabdus alkalitolerans]|uniref:Acylpyruvate hydrolase n=1 Tax=Pelagirhabdus alkalitolerans TaxID=1612202 RepID=A0A1G6GKC9_9BACI|nr:fumarylacetoacetate hydrolase family protein [Pelagirhabdus alkalitolerans]SDB82447.1 acylpyruvate hydrolase [Pelagirhabdus alkalitolerans]
MRLVTYKNEQVSSMYRMGYEKDGKIVDLERACQEMVTIKQDMNLVDTIESICPSDPNLFFQMGSWSFNKAEEVVSFFQTHDFPHLYYDQKDVKLGPPVVTPHKIICIGTNYKDHVHEMKTELPTYPVLFAKFANALIGPDDSIEKSPLTEKLDYEVELAVVIKEKAKNISKEDAIDYIAGYTIANDISARDLQKRTPQWLQGKTLDRSTPIGPWIVTPQDIKDPQALKIESFVNGERRQSSNTEQMIFKIDEIIEFISSLMTLEPGDIILTGTPDGVGFAQDPPAFLQAGDEVSLSIEEIGTLTNRVIE